jgi:hypothetical protein
MKGLSTAKVRGIAAANEVAATKKKSMAIFRSLNQNAELLLIKYMLPR